MRRVLSLSAILLSACASSQGGSAPPVPDQTYRIPSGDGGTTTMRAIGSDPSFSTKTISASAERIWSVLPAVYQSLGLPVTDRDAAAHTIGSSSFKVRRQLGNVPLSRYLDCGSTQGGSSADSYEILISVNTRVQSGPLDSTTVSTVVDAMGRPVFLSAEYIHCGSKGSLEKEFFALMDAQLRG